MIIPKNDKRKFKLGVLKNKIKYCIIEDINETKTNICVSVKIGSIMNPLTNQGLAHFLEHMLFMGSIKYPQTNYFFEEVKKNGGMTNAYTASFNTNYFFNCFNDNIEHIIDIFSRFFIDPLFDINSVEKEINAIQSEHNKNKNNMFWRLFEMICKFSNSNKQLNKFGTGSIESFNKNVRKEMIEFYKKYYTSDNMSITIISNLKLKKQLELLKIFENIKSKKVVKYTINKPFFCKDRYYYNIIPLKNSNDFIMVFETDLKVNTSHNMYYDFIMFLLENNSNNTLKNRLLKKKLINSMDIELFDEGIFLIYFNVPIINKSIMLKILIQFYSYINYIKNMKEKEIIKIYNYFKKILEYNFHNRPQANNIDIINTISTNLHNYDSKYFYSAHRLIFNKFNNSEFKSIINILYKPNFITFKKDIIKDYLTEKYYKIKYKKLQYPKLDIVTKKYNIDYEFDNSKQYLIEKKINNVTRMKKPKLVRHNIIYQANNIDNMVYIDFNIYVKELKNKYYNLQLDILLDAISYYHNMKFDNINDLGYSFSTSINTLLSTIVFHFNGYNTYIEKYIIDTFKYIMKIKIEKYVIDIIINNIKQSIKNKKLMDIWSGIDYMINYTFNPIVLKDEFILKNINKININSFFKKTDILNKPYTLYISGNINKSIIDNITKYLNNNNKYITNTNISIKPTSFIKNKKEKDNSICMMYNIGSFNVNKFNLMELLLLRMSELFFNELRTKQQLGYKVSCYSMILYGKYYIVQKIQSRKKVTDLQNRIEHFNKVFYNEIQTFNINKLKKTLTNIYKEKHKKNITTYNSYKYIVDNMIYDFNRKEKLLKALKKIEIKDLQKFYKKYITNPIIFTFN